MSPTGCDYCKNMAHLFYLTWCLITKVLICKRTTHLVLQCWRLWSTPETRSIHFLWFPAGLSGCGAAGPPWRGLRPVHVRHCGGWWKAPPCLHWTAPTSTQSTDTKFYFYYIKKLMGKGQRRLFHTSDYIDLINAVIKGKLKERPRCKWVRNISQMQRN